MQSSTVCSAGHLLEKLAGLLSGWRRQSGLAAFVTRLENAGVPGLLLGMDGAKPTPADTAVESCGRIAGLIHGRNGLTRPLEVPGFCLIHLLQLVKRWLARWGLPNLSSRGRYLLKRDRVRGQERPS